MPCLHRVSCKRLWQVLHGHILFDAITYRDSNVQEGCGNRFSECISLMAYPEQIQAVGVVYLQQNRAAAGERE